jgi:hypothetical protein
MVFNFIRLALQIHLDRYVIKAASRAKARIKPTAMSSNQGQTAPAAIVGSRL